MARIHGKNGQVKMDTTPTSPMTTVAIANLNAWSLDMAIDQVEVTAFLDTNKQYVSGLPDFRGDIGGWYDATSLSFLNAVLAGTTVGLDLVPDSTLATTYFRGLANLSANIAVSATGAVTMGGNWTAAGNWILETA